MVVGSGVRRAPCRQAECRMSVTLHGTSGLRPFSPLEVWPLVYRSWMAHLNQVLADRERSAAKSRELLELVQKKRQRRNDDLENEIRIARARRAESWQIN